VNRRIALCACLLLALAACGGGSGTSGADAAVEYDVPEDPGAAEDAAPETVPDAAMDLGPETCTPDCASRECGDDGCGGSCGTCPGGCGGILTCYEGSCGAVPCCPNCAERQCGSDGCYGTCGTCAGPDMECDMLRGECVVHCDWTTDRPFLWSATGVVSSMQTPATTAIVQATCFDYTGDGLGDNGLKGLADQVNGPIADAIAADSFALLLELAGVTDFTDTASFVLNGLVGTSTATPPVAQGDFLVQERSYVPDICLPMIQFQGARITAGALAAGPHEFQLSIPVSEGLVIDATLIQAMIKANITAGATADGFAATDGVLSGVLTKLQLETAIAKLQASCDAAPADAKPDYCSSLKFAFSAMTLLFDLHQVGDGTFVARTKELPGDAASVCLTFTLSKARVIDMAP
jgi:hypothetical protein